MRFTNNYIFPLHLRFIPLLLTVGVSLLPLAQMSFADLWGHGHYQFFLPMYFLSIVIATATRGVKIRLDQPVVKPYWSVLGLKIGSWVNVGGQDSLRLSSKGVKPRDFWSFWFQDMEKSESEDHGTWYLKLRSVPLGADIVIRKSKDRKELNHTARKIAESWGVTLYGERGFENVLLIPSRAA